MHPRDLADIEARAEAGYWGLDDEEHKEMAVQDIKQMVDVMWKYIRKYGPIGGRDA